VHIIVGYTTGGIVDVFARLIGECLSERPGQSFVVEDRPGAASNLATAAVVRHLPTGTRQS
jgi:tripartite-type tricarboxylate transporter receptor subunit TctC